ncbi:MAG: patatin family protein [Propionibacteriaceae bacterium]|nr:patatin family protein [Propionibacteriaceae bacterium]
MDMTNNVTDTALIFEGGGMRGSFSAGVVTTLLAEGIFFDYVAGISAGSSNTVNYISRNPERARQSFVDFADNPKFGSWKTWLQGKGMFNAKFIYEESGLPGGPLPFDFDRFMANHAEFRIGGFDVAAGQTIYWSRKDIHQTFDLMTRVRASSSIPMVMPPVTINGRMYVDGALGVGGGIPLPVAQRDGYTKFFVVLTQKRGYVKRQQRPSAPLKAYYWKHPTIAEGILHRAGEYNAILEELKDLERRGQACLVFPDHMNVTNGTRNVPALQATYDEGIEQARRELPRWKEFLNLG